MKNFNEKYEGFSILEIVVAMGIFVIMVGSVAVFSMDAVAFVKNQEITIDANSQMNQLMDGVIDYKAIDWSGLSSQTGGTNKYFSISGDVLAIATGTNVSNGVTTYFTVEDVYRDEDNNIVETGGLLDPHTKKVIVYASWDDYWGTEQNRSILTYVNDWEIQRWRNDEESEWVLGTHDRTMGTNEEGGEVTLELVVDFAPNWCNPILSTTYYNIPGSGVPTSVRAQGEYAFFTTGANASGVAFTKMLVTPVAYDEPQVSFLGSWDTGKINYSYAIPSTRYALLATDDNAREVRIINHDITPYKDVGTVNAPGVQDSHVTTAIGTVGYVAYARNLTSFDLTAFTGARTVYDTITIGGSSGIIKDLDPFGDYMFVGIEMDTYELYVVDITDPYDLVVVNQFSVNSMNTRDVVVTESGERAFVLTSLSATEDELFLLDISDPDGTISVVNSIDVSTMQTTSLAVVEEDKVFVVAGDHYTGQMNYRVWTWEDEEEFIDCGGMEVDENFNDIDATTLIDPVFEVENYYTYAIVENSDAEFQIVRGDEGEFGGQGYGYYAYGTYYSPVYDTDSANVDYYYFRWLETLVEGTDITMQVRAATTSGGVESASWIGPDGTDTTWFTDPTYAEIPSSLDGKQYMQFKAYMTTSSPDYTPVLERIDIFFEE